MTHNHQTAKFLVETKGIAIKHRGAVFTAARTSSTQALYCKRPKTVSINIRCANHIKCGLDKASRTKLSKRSRACALHNIFLFVIRWHRSQNIVMQAIFRCKKCHISPVKIAYFDEKRDTSMAVVHNIHNYCIKVQSNRQKKSEPLCTRTG